MYNPTPLHSASTLGDLLLHECQVSPSTPGHVLENEFDQRPHLPGVLVIEGAKIIGVISRRRFHQRMSKGYGQEIFLRRPIQVFLDLMSDASFLQLPQSESIEVAMERALARCPEELYEPLVVTQAEGRSPVRPLHRLVDFHTLLLAQSEILKAKNFAIHQQALKLKEERQKVKDYAQLLEKQQGFIRERNQLLEQQKAELVQQSKRISELNQRFLQIGHILSREGKKAFQATFEGVNTICRNTGQIVENGRALTNELHTVHVTSKVIEKVSQQVRHLAIQAAIVANQEGSKLGGFNHVTNEIGNLGSQIFEAGRQIDFLADRFESRIEELTQLAQKGTVAARSLIEKIQQAAIALAELENLVKFESTALLRRSDSTSDTAEEPPEETAFGSPDEAQELTQRISSLESTISELKALVKQKDSQRLVSKIQKTLDQNKRA